MSIKWKRILKKRGRFLLYGLGAAAFLFIGVEALIISGFFRQGEKNLDYIIVLGARVKGREPSLSLKYRIEEAAAYLRENPLTRAVLSGAQGADEEITEASCMKEELVARGISEDRLLPEERSTSTKENLEFSLKIIEADGKSAGKDQNAGGDAGQKVRKARIGIVSNGFHIFRAAGIARRTGYHDAQGIAAKSVWWRLPQDMFREFFAVCKDVLVGNM